VTDRQQRLVDALREWQAAYPHVVVRNPDGVDQFAEEVALVVESQVVAAERAGYERCKQDASTAIKGIDAIGYGRRSFKHTALAALAALNATQQEASDG
jgi:hypothetical protein